MDIAFEAFALESPLEQGTFDQTESWLVLQRRAHASDPEAAQLIEQIANVADRLEAPRCRFSASLLLELDKPSPDEPVAPRPPALHPFTSAPHTRAYEAEHFAIEVLRGVATPRAMCGLARVSAARAWAPVLAELERRDGVEAATEDDPELRAQVARLRAIDQEMEDTSSSDDPRAARIALQREAVAILETWSPRPSGLAALRDYDYDHPVDPEGAAWAMSDEQRRQLRALRTNLGERAGHAAFGELRALLRWAIRGAIRRAMPPVQSRSGGARAVRAYLEALRSDATRAVTLGASLVERLPTDHAPEDDPEPYRRDPELVARACGDAPSPVAPEEDLDEAEMSEEELMAEEHEEMREFFGPDEYVCSADYDGRALGLLASRFDETDREDLAAGEPEPPPSGALALYLLEQGCDAGNARSCGLLGWHLAEGPAETRDATHARELLRRGCEDREEYEVAAAPPACVRYARLLRAGAGGPADPTLAWEVLDQPCALFFTPACDARVEMVRAGESPLGPDEQMDALRDWCEVGAPQACHEYGLRGLRAARSEDEIEPALSALVRACNVMGMEAACVPLVRVGLHWDRYRHLASNFLGGMCYRDGGEAWCGWAAHLSESASRAETAERGCEAGSPDGCAAAAIISGERATLQQHCDEGSSLACYTLAEGARRRDPARARELYGRSCGDDDDLAMGCAELAELLSSRRGGPVDAAAAQSARARACEIARHPGTCD